MKIIAKINVVTLIIAFLTLILGWQLGHFDYKIQIEKNRPKISIENKIPQGRQEIDFKLFWQVWDLVSKEYVDKKALDPQKMYYGAIAGMVQALGDPYTVFLPPEAQKTTKEELGGSFEGVGIQLGFNKEKRLVVVAPLKGTPADKAGIKAVDMIIKIDDKDTTGISLPEAVNLIRGKKGTKVTLEILREDEEKPKVFILSRDTIIIKSVEFEAKIIQNNKKIAYIKLSRFGEKTEEEWNKAVSDALAIGPKGIILDLRNNPGGFLEGSVFIGSEFIPKGKDIVFQEDSQGGKKSFKSDRDGRLLNIPLVVLINKGSASAAEIVAGAIQDHKRGKLVGEQSFGKGTIQEAQELSSGTGLHITTAKWLTPGGKWIHNSGLVPDINIENVNGGEKDTKDEQLEKALELY